MIVYDLLDVIAAENAQKDESSDEAEQTYDVRHQVEPADDEA